MPNYYAFDIIKTSDGGYKFVDFHGTSGGGLNVISGVYGNIDRVKRFVRILDNIAKGKTIIYSRGHTFAGLAFIPEENEFTEYFADLYPTTQWVDSQLQYQRREKARAGKRAPSFKLNEHFLHRAVRDMNSEGEDVDMLFCTGFEKKGSAYVATGARRGPNERKKDIEIEPSEIGVYFQKGNASYPDFLLKDTPFPVINNPYIDALFDNKMFIRYFLQNTEFKELLPRHIYVGMGMSSKKAIKDFIKNFSDERPSLVLKPILGAGGVGIDFLGKRDVEKLFKLDKKQKNYDLSILESVLDLKTLPLRLRDKRSSFELEDLVYNAGTSLSKDYSDFVAGSIPAKGETNENTDDIPLFLKPQMDKIALFLFPHNGTIIDHYISILDEYVEPEAIQSKEGTYHEGYIRLLVLDGKVMASLYRFLEEPWKEGEFVDINDPATRTKFEPVDERTEAELSEIVSRLVPAMEEKVISEVSSFDDMERIRSDIMKSHLKRAYEEEF